ncbi:MAG: 4-hydroxy-tetrahydrodipicolinate reductase [Defluviitaleaceae bacterium]|nr:4-hydroxy-tetrahydrodipicolinate reductase [Defluviitaleaceae bacterium]
MKIIIHGLGRLGQAVAELAPDGCVVEAIDPNISTATHFPVHKEVDKCNQDSADVIVDCSHAGAVAGLLRTARIPLVICTTGIDEATMELVKLTAQRIPVFLSANMSLGVNFQVKLAGETAGTLASKGFDIEILEAHHNQKLDAPSGTAIMLADSINKATGGKLKYVYDRSQYMQKRGEDEIGISSIRGGTIVGEHTVIFAGHDEIIEITHRALSREIYARGALVAAEFIVGKTAGLYSMDDILK